MVCTGKIITEEWPESLPCEGTWVATIEYPCHTTEGDDGHEENGTCKYGQTSSLFNGLRTNFSVESIVHIPATGPIAVHRVGVQDEFGTPVHGSSPLDLPQGLIVALPSVSGVNAVVSSTSVRINLDHLIDVHQSPCTGPKVESTQCQGIGVISRRSAGE